MDIERTNKDRAAMDKPETGAASLIIELSDGRITVTHATDKVELTAWNARKGDWSAIWDTLRKLATNEIQK